jgi:Pyridoxamine 5'-phosphate oxidase
VLPPVVSRPRMPGYGVLPAEEGGGLLPWDWALERLHDSHDYWVSTMRPGGIPHCMPVWGVWREGIWFSSSLGSRKARNLAANPGCCIATGDPAEPVVLEGIAQRILDLEVIAEFVTALNRKYGTDYGADFFAPDRNAVFHVRPTKVIALASANFVGSPTRWTF